MTNHDHDYYHDDCSLCQMEKESVMICNKNNPDFEWSFRIVFDDPENIDETVLTILQDYGATIVDDSTDSIYFK